MKNHFEDKVKDKMKQLSFEETGLDPDINAVWNKIKDKNNATVSKTIKFKSVLSHAAAVLVGIIISASLLFSIFNKKKVEVNNQFATVNLQKSEPSQTISKIDTVFIEKTIVKVEKHNNLVKTSKEKERIDKTEIAHNNTLALQNNNNEVAGGKHQQRLEMIEGIQGNMVVSTQSAKAAKPKEIIYWSDIQRSYQNSASEEKQNIIAQILKPDTPEYEVSNKTTNSPFLAFSKSFKNN